MQEMTPLEAAEVLENGDCGQSDYDAIEVAVTVLRKIAAGEYTPVVRSEWSGWTKEAFTGLDEYGDPRCAKRTYYLCGKCNYGTVVKTHYCPNCGARMDGDPHV